MKSNIRVLWLFLMPCFVPLFVWLVRSYQSNQSIVVQSGGYSSDAAGERQTLLVLALALKRNPSLDKVTVTYDTFTLQVKHSIWLRSLSYNRSDKTLTKESSGPQRKKASDPLKTEVWTGVSEEMIQSLTAPLQNQLAQGKPYLTGNVRLQGLAQYGAKRQP